MMTDTRFHSCQQLQNQLGLAASLDVVESNNALKAGSCNLARQNVQEYDNSNHNHGPRPDF
jgi:hypothetical protein